MIAYGEVQGISENQRGEVLAQAAPHHPELGGKPGQGYPAAFVPASGVRRLTPLECERLQGFPTNGPLLPTASNSTRYRQLGNAVAVPVVAWIARRMVEGRRSRSAPSDTEGH